MCVAQLIIYKYYRTNLQQNQKKKKFAVVLYRFVLNELSVNLTGIAGVYILHLDHRLRLLIYYNNTVYEFDLDQ